VDHKPLRQCQQWLASSWKVLGHSVFWASFVKQQGAELIQADRIPSLNINGGGNLPQAEYCENILTEVLSYLLFEPKITPTPGVPRPSLSISMPAPNRDESEVFQCIPLPGNVSQEWRNAPWGPGSPPVVNIYGGAYKDAVDSSAPGCSEMVDIMANSISQVYSSVKHSRFQNWAIGPRGGHPTVDVEVPRGPQSVCIHAGVYNGGQIPGIWPRTTIIATAIVTGIAPTSGVTAAQAGNMFSTNYLTPTATPTATSQASEQAMAPLGPLNAETIETDQVPCRPFADQVTSDWSRVAILDKKTPLKLDCW
jgi:hypothetical protein